MGRATAFAVVAGNHSAEMVYPTEKRLVPASERTRAEAKDRLQRLVANGGTAIGQWLLRAQRLFDSYDAELRHAILLTDGNPEPLEANTAVPSGMVTASTSAPGPPSPSTAPKGPGSNNLAVLSE